MSLINDALRAVRSQRSTPPATTSNGGGGGGFPPNKTSGGGALVPVIAGCVGVGVVLLLLITVLVFAFKEDSPSQPATPANEIASMPAEPAPPPMEVSTPPEPPAPAYSPPPALPPAYSGAPYSGPPYSTQQTPPAFEPPSPAANGAGNEFDSEALTAQIERLSSRLAEAEESSQMERNRLGDTVETVIGLLDDRGRPETATSHGNSADTTPPIGHGGGNTNIFHGNVTIVGSWEAKGNVNAGGGGAGVPALAGQPIAAPMASAVPGIPVAPTGALPGTAWAPPTYVYPGVPGYVYPQAGMPHTGQTVAAAPPVSATPSGPMDFELQELHEQNQKLLNRLAGIGDGLEDQKATPITGEAPAEKPTVVLDIAEKPAPKTRDVHPQATSLPTARPMKDHMALWEDAVATHGRLNSPELPPQHPDLIDPRDLYSLLGNQDEEEPQEVTRWQDEPFSFDNVFRSREYNIDPGFRAGPLRMEAFDSSAITSGDFNFSLVDKGFKPSDAKLRLGNLFIDAKYLEYSVIWSDNVERIAFEEGDPSAGFVQMLALQDVAAILQLSEGFQFAATGQLIYLPGKGKGGLNGFGIRRDVLTVPLADGEADVFAMEVSDTARIGGWDVVLADKLHLSDTALEAKYDARILEELMVLEEQSIAAEDRKGEYSFGEIGRRDAGDLNSRNRLDDRVQDDVNTVLVNDASIFASKLVPTETLVTAGVFRRDSQPLDEDDSDSSGIREWREGATLLVQSQRPGMRFKPYGTYTIEHTNENPDWRETGRVGFWGPLSDYLDLTTSAGFTKEPGGTTDYLYDLSLFHQPRWNTTQAVTFNRTITLPEDKLVTESNYRLQHQISDYWGTAFFLGREATERKINGEVVEDTEWGGGASLVFSPGPKLRMALRGIYEDRKTGGTTSAGADNGGQWIYNFATTYNPIPELDFYYSYTREQKDWEHLFETKLRRGKLELAYRFIWSEDHEPDKEERENLLILSYKIPL